MWLPISASKHIKGHWYPRLTRFGLTGGPCWHKRVNEKRVQKWEKNIHPCKDGFNDDDDCAVQCHREERWARQDLLSHPTITCALIQTNALFHISLQFSNYFFIHLRLYLWNCMAGSYLVLVNSWTDLLEFTIPLKHQEQNIMLKIICVFKKSDSIKLHNQQGPSAIHWISVVSLLYSHRLVVTVMQLGIQT